MSVLTPQQLAQQWVAPVLDDGNVIGVAFGYDRIVKEWKPTQADELEATGRLMLELAERLRTARVEVNDDDRRTNRGALDRGSPLR